MSLMPDSLENTRERKEGSRSGEVEGGRGLERITREAEESRVRESKEKEGKKVGKSSGFCNLFQLV